MKFLVLKTWSLCLVLLLATHVEDVTGADEAAKEESRRHEARQLADQANRHLRSKEFEQAEQAYGKAIVAWNKVLRTSKGDKKATDQIKRCENNRIYSHTKLIDLAREAAESLAKNGKVKQASEEMLIVAARYLRAYKKTGQRSLQQNRQYCLSKSALLPIMHGDKLAKEGKQAEASEYYQLGVDQYQTVHKILGRKKYANNLKYAALKLANAKFAHLLQSGLAAPNFQLTSAQGQPIQLADYRGKVVLVTYWAAWCGSCRRHLPKLDQFYKDHQDEGLVVLGLNVDRVKGWDRNAFGKAKEMIEKELTFPIAWATSETLTDYGQPSSVPTMFWVDRAGNLVKQVKADKTLIERLEKDFQEFNAKL